MQRYVVQRTAELAAQQPPGEETVHFTESLAALVVEELCPRRAVGVELLADRVAHVRRRAPGAEVVEGDARRLADLVAGPVDLVLTSPPYRPRNAHPEDPLTGYASDGGGYEEYLRDLADVFADAARLLRPGGHLVVNVANLRHEEEFTPLAWDLARTLDGLDELDLLHEVYVAWDSLPPDLTGDYLLVLRRPGA